MEREEKGTVCVTGGAGYFASWLVMRLLQHGYSVRATVRSDPKFKKDVTHLTTLPEASQRLEIFEADLEKPESFNNVIDGCIGVFHVAHPWDFEGTKESQERAIAISVEGTLGILKACLKSKTIKKVVYTSSAAAAVGISNRNQVKEIDENMWSEVETLSRRVDTWYPISKTLTEKAALEFAEENGLDLVSILPSMIVGRFITSTLPFSFVISQALVLGTKEQCTLLKKLQSAVHIDDVASAHIFLFETQKAKGRYVCSSDDITIQDIANFTSTKYPRLQLQMDSLGEFEEEQPIPFSSKKLLNLGFKFKYGFEDMYSDAMDCCIEKGFI